jgi:glutamate racemase
VYATQNKRIGVIGTKGTVQSRTYENEIKSLDPSAKVVAVACPLFVPFVEEGWLKGRVVFDVAKVYLRPLIEAKVDTVILGCTHYPLLKPLIGQVLGRHVRLIDSAEQVAIEVKKLLSSEGITSSVKRKARRRFFVSDNPTWFNELAERFLGYSVPYVEKVNNV